MEWGRYIMRQSYPGRSGVIAVLALIPLLAACEQEAEAPPLAARQVRTVVIEARDSSTSVNLTGRIEAEDEVPLAFRISGGCSRTTASWGPVQTGDLVARLESQNEENQLRAAAAALSAAEAQYNQARGHYERQQTLFRQGWATRANYDWRKRACGRRHPRWCRRGADGCRGGPRRIH